MPSLRKPKSLLINPAFQVSVIAWFTAVALAVILVFLGSILWFFRNLKAQGLAAGLPEGHPLFRYIQSQEMQFYQIFALSSLVALVIIVAGGLLLSHRVAGPLHRLTEHLLDSEGASPGPVKFRTGDYFPELERAFNDFLSRRK